MPKQAFKMCFSLFIVLSLLVNYSVSTNSNKQYAPTASESVDRSTEPTDVQTEGEQDLLDQQLASSPSVNADNNITISPSVVGNSVLDTGDTDSHSRENTSVALWNADPPAAETNGNGIGVTVQENTSLPATVETTGDNDSLTSPSPSVVDNSVLDTGDMDSLSRENTSVSRSNADPPSAETKRSGIGVIEQENTSVPPTVETNGDNSSLTSPSPSTSMDDNSVLDTGDMESISQENTSVPLSKADPPVAETKESSNEDLVQENTSLPPTVETREEGNNVSQENALVPSSPPPSLSPAYVDTPAFETSDDGSFTQENQSPPSNTVSENPENEPQLNDYNSQPSNVILAPSKAVSYPGLDPTIESTPPKDDTYDSAPTSNQHTILPFNYRAEDEPVEPSEEEEDSWNRANGAVAGVLVGACVIGVAAFVYQKRKKDNVRAQYQYQCLGKKEGA